METEIITNDILDIADAYRAFGYILTAEPIAGMAENFVSSNRNVLEGLAAALSVINHQYKTRGKSKSALSILHSRRPNPAFGVEVAS